METNNRQNQHNYSHLMSHNWANSEDSKIVIRKLVKSLSVPSSVEFIKRRDLPHSRQLVIEFENGRKITIFLDQGMGFWKLNNYNIEFDFCDDLNIQAS